MTDLTYILNISFDSSLERVNDLLNFSPRILLKNMHRTCRAADRLLGGGVCAVLRVQISLYMMWQIKWGCRILIN